MHVKPQVVAVILAGGVARRMGGGDKPLLDVGGHSMLHAVIAAVGLSSFAISANGDPQRFAAFDCPVLADGEFAGQGPLAGLLAGLHWADMLGVEALLTVPGDMPFLPHGFAAWLLPAPCAVMSDRRRHHLVATWPVSCLESLRSFLGSGTSRSVADFASIVCMQYVEFPVISFASFANINTQRQLELARRFASPAGCSGLPAADDWGDFDA